MQVEIALAPKGWTSRQVLIHLKLDPYQSRVSQHPIILTHPRTGKQAILKEYVEDLLGDSRFCIEATDKLVWVSKLQSPGGTIFLPTAVTEKSILQVRAPSGDIISA